MGRELYYIFEHLPNMVALKVLSDVNFAEGRLLLSFHAAEVAK